MVYKLKSGFRLSPHLDEDAVCNRLEQLHDRYGELRPELMVEDGVDPSSPLHEAFEWDDSAAAHEYRLEQARYLIRAIVVIDESIRSEPFRAYIHVKNAGYQKTQTVMSEPEMRKYVLSEALAELQAWRIKYQDLQELADIFTAMDLTT